MKNPEFTLELSDGTTFAVDCRGDHRHPDIKAFYLPEGALQPFSSKNLPTERRRHANQEAALSGSL